VAAVVRRAGAERLPELEPLWSTLNATHARLAPELAGLPARSAPESWALRRALYELWLAEDGAFLLLAEEDGVAVGYALVRLAGPLQGWASRDRIGVVESLSVLPDRHGNGIGTRLLDAVAAELEAAGVDSLEIANLARNADAARLYDRRGLRLAFEHRIGPVRPPVRPAGQVEIRPMRGDDVEACDDVAWAAFSDLAERQREPMGSRDEQGRARARERTRHLLATDPDGCVVAEAGGRIVGCAVALVREGVWGLSLLVVDPALQSAGTGRRLLDATLRTAQSARGAMILSSSDRRALRSYSRSGFDLIPAVSTWGTVRRDGLRAAPLVRDGGTADLDLAAALGRELRGASHGPDLEVLARVRDMLVVPDRGVCFSHVGQVSLLLARDEEAAMQLLTAALAGAGPDDRAMVHFLTAANGWGHGVALDAGLDLYPNGGVFVRGELGPLAPYLPSGAYL
jgi:GNAT superfamily N-acetyltransferase